MLKSLTALWLGLTLSMGATAQHVDQPQPGSAAEPQRPTQGNTRQTQTTNDALFMQRAARGSSAEIELSKAALKKSTNPKVVQYAQNMITDHEKAGIELKTLAEGMNVSLPTGLDESHAQQVNELQKLSGEDFDATYIELMKKDHDAMMGLFENAANDADLDPQVRNFANKLLPILATHQTRAHALTDEPAKMFQSR